MKIYIYIIYPVISPTWSNGYYIFIAINICFTTIEIKNIWSNYGFDLQIAIMRKTFKSVSLILMYFNAEKKGGGKIVIEKGKGTRIPKKG